MSEIKTRKRMRGNKEGSVVKLSGNRKRPFGARITVGWSSEGKQQIKYLGYYKTKTEAKKALNEYLANPYSLDKYTVQDILEKWASKAKLKEATIYAYSSAVKSSGLLNKVFTELKLMELEEAVGGETPSMQLRLKKAFGNLYDYAIRNEIADKNLASLIETDDYNPKEKDVIKPEDIKLILNGEDVIPIIMLYTGFRIGEVLSLECENIDLESRIMIGGSKTKAGKNRKVPIHKALMPIIEKLKAEGNKYLVTNADGNKINYSNYLTRVWKENAVLSKYTTHQCRHTFISRRSKLELSLDVLQKIVGHSSGNVTISTYTHVDNEQLLNYIDAFYY